MYSATKFGLRGFSLALREDFRPHNVGVTTIFPGFIRDAGMFASTGVVLPPGAGTRSPEGATIWAHLGGFASPNNQVKASAYPDPGAQADAKALVSDAVHAFRDDVAGRRYPADGESYHLPKDTRTALETVLERKRAMRR